MRVGKASIIDTFITLRRLVYKGTRRKLIVPLVMKKLNLHIVTQEELLSHDKKYHTFSFGSQEKVLSCKPYSLERLPQQLENRKGELTAPVPFVAEVRNAELIGSMAVGFDQEGNVIEESTLPHNPNSGFKFEALPIRTLVQKSIPFSRKVTQLDTACSLVNLWSKNYFHWIVECLTRIEGLEHYQEQTGRQPLLIIDSNPTLWQLESLKLLGYEPSRCLQWDNSQTKVQQLVVSSFRRTGGFISPSACRWVRQRLLSNLPALKENKTPFTPRVYISRAKASCRKVVNETEVMDLLTPLGFVEYKLENMSFLEQVRLFSQAEIIISPHGAGLTNMIFSEDAIVIELFNPHSASSYINACYVNMASALNFHYGCLICQPSRIGLDFRRTEPNMVVDTTKLKALIDSMLMHFAS